MEKIIDFCANRFKAKGIKEFEIYALSSEQTVVEVKEGQENFVQKGNDRGLSLRVLRDGRLGFGYTTNVGKESLEHLLDEIAAQLEVVPQDDKIYFPQKASVYPKLNAFDDSFYHMDVSSKIDFAKQMEAAAKDHSPFIKRVRQSQLKASRCKVWLLNQTFDEPICYQASRFQASILVMAEHQGESEMGWHFAFSPFFKKLNPQSIGVQAAKKATEALGARPIASQRVKAILLSEVASEFLSLLSNAFLAETVQKGKSFLASYLGKKAMSSLIQIYDDGLYPEAWSTRPFDDEGVPQQRTCLVDSGVIKGFLYDTYTAAKDQTVSTGNARKAGLSTPPKVGITNFFIASGRHSLEDLFKEMDTGLVVTDVLGMHTADPISGEFSVGIAGYWVEKGEKAFPVKGVAMAGNVLEVFKRVVAVGNDLQFWGPCGAPSILVEDVQISGN